MKKLCRSKGSTVHPTPSIVSDNLLLSFLPAAILALTVALSPSDKEVLAYLISCSSCSSSTTSSTTHPKKRSDDHAPSFSCSCFGCYISYWVRWDTSPNRQLIHEIIDAYEDSLLKTEKRSRSNTNRGNGSSKREKRKGKNVKAKGYDAAGELKKKEAPTTTTTPSEVLVVVSKEEYYDDVAGKNEAAIDAADVDEEADVAASALLEEEKSSMRRFVSFLGERIWSGVWG